MTIDEFLHLYDTLESSDKRKILMKTTYGDLSWRGSYNIYIYGKYPLPQYIKENLAKIKM